MKKFGKAALVLMIFLLLLCSLTACGSDKQARAKEVASLLEGTWEAPGMFGESVIVFSSVKGNSGDIEWKGNRSLISGSSHMGGIFALSLNDEETIDVMLTYEINRDGSQTQTSAEQVTLTYSYEDGRVRVFSGSGADVTEYYKLG